MTKSERLIRSITGMIRSDIRPAAYAIDEIAELMFVRKIPQPDIHVTRDIYPAVAKRLGKSVGSAARSIQRITRLCWDEVNPGRLIEIFGRMISEPGTSEILFYLAYLLYYGRPFFEVLEDLEDINPSA